MAIRPADFAQPSDLQAYHAVHAELRREAWPDKPPRSLDNLRREFDAAPDFMTIRQWLAWDGDAPVGLMHLRWRSGEDNQQLATAFFGVLPSHRRRGVASALLRVATRVALDAGRTSLIADSDSMVGASGLTLERLGGKKGIVVRLSRMDLEHLDRALMSTWLASGEALGDEFELLFWGPHRVPEPNGQEFADLHHVMNSAPLEDLDVEPFILTVEQLRAAEASRVARGIDWWATVVRHVPSGELAGYTDVFIDPDDRTVIYQGDTGVWHKYRGRGLGRWIKAANLMRVLPLIPEARWIETGNAGSNRPMLSINEAMGFYPYKQFIGWQFDVASLHARVGKQPAA